MLTASVVLLLFCLAAGLLTMKLPAMAKAWLTEANRAYWNEAGKYADRLRCPRDFLRYRPLRRLKARIERIEAFTRRVPLLQRAAYYAACVFGGVSLVLAILWIAWEMNSGL